MFFFITRFSLCIWVLFSVDIQIKGINVHEQQLALVSFICPWVVFMSALFLDISLGWPSYSAGRSLCTPKLTSDLVAQIFSFLIHVEATVPFKTFFMKLVFPSVQ